MGAVRAGDVHCIGLLFERHHRQLFRFFYRLFDDRASADDLVQDVFVRVLKYPHTYRDGVPFAPWLFRIARNAGHDFAKGCQTFESIADEQNVAAKEPDPAVHFEQREQVALLKQALMRLPLAKRELIVLARWHGMSHQQLGELMGVDGATMRVRLHRALQQLESLLARCKV